MNSDSIFFIGGGILLTMFLFALPSLIADLKIAYALAIQRWEEEEQRLLDEQSTMWGFDSDQFDPDDWFEIPEDEPAPRRIYPRRLRRVVRRKPIHWDWHRTR